MFPNEGVCFFLIDSFVPDAPPERQKVQSKSLTEENKRLKTQHSQTEEHMEQCGVESNGYLTGGGLLDDPYWLIETL